MIELTKTSGAKVSINPKSIVSIATEAFGVCIAMQGGFTYSVKESYEEVIQRVKGTWRVTGKRPLETK